MSDMLNPHLSASRIAAVDTERRVAEVRVQQQRAETDRVSQELAATRQQMLDTPKRKPANWHQEQETLGKLMRAEEENARLAGLIREWRHSNDAFKAVARAYALRLGISDEERQAEFWQCVVDIGAEQPEFAKTQLAGRARDKLAGKA